MELSLFDLHCDTAYEMHRRHLSLGDLHLATSQRGSARYTHYLQVMAHWTPPSISDREGWSHLLSVYEHLFSDPALSSRQACVFHFCPDTPPTIPTLLLSLEDARILDNDLSRVSKLSRMGFCMVTPLWRGHSSIGGAHDTDKGLTPFGKAALSKMLKHGILLDVSHASERSFEEILSLSDEYSLPAIATHSNAYSVCPVSRNLRNGQIRQLLLQNGIIGLNLCTDFLCQAHDATAEHVLRHIDCFTQLGAENALCFGCDFDGAHVPRDLSHVSSLPTVAEALLKRNYSEAFVRGLFFENAFRFAKRYIQKRIQT